MSPTRAAAVAANLLVAVALGVIGLIHAASEPLLTSGGCFLLGVGVVVALMNVVILNDGDGR